ncbi:MAG: transposase [Candidatus Yanofskybacteria bacterium]|nr:transposase [Candidatus Yanofskybacteria bacterium]
MRKIRFENGEFYHVFNRGNNKRPIFIDRFDLNRFLLSMREFNTKEPIGSLYSLSLEKGLAENPTPKSKRLVDFVCYCLNPNHYHFLVQQLEQDGVQKFIHRLGTGYTRYLNDKHNFSGALFQGRYKAIHVDSNEYLLHLNAYINLNPEAHQIRGSSSKLLSKTSWEEYLGKELPGNSFCNKKIILSQFSNITEYKDFAKKALAISKERKEMVKSLELLLLT